jgi:hypothetical protein
MERGALIGGVLIVVSLAVAVLFNCSGVKPGPEAGKTPTKALSSNAIGPSHFSARSPVSG